MPAVFVFGWDQESNSYVVNMQVVKELFKQSDLTCIVDVFCSAILHKL